MVVLFARGESTEPDLTSSHLSPGCLKKHMLLYIQDPRAVMKDSLFVGVQREQLEPKR